MMRLLAVVSLLGIVALHSASGCGVAQVCPDGTKKVCTCPDLHVAAPGEICGPSPDCVTQNACYFTCVSPVNLKCLPKPTYVSATRTWYPARTLPATTLALLSKPLVCGGASSVPCPSIACANSTSIALSGPYGCSTAQSQIQALANSQFYADTPPPLQVDVIKSYADDVGCGTPPTPGELQPLIATATTHVVQAVATVVASTFAQFNTYVCTCCFGSSYAYTVVKAHIQAVAKAQAVALASALAQVEDCNHNVLSLGLNDDWVTAVAEAIELAIDDVYREVVSRERTNCIASSLETEMEENIARALACSLGVAFAMAADSITTQQGFACGQTLAMSGSYLNDNNMQCPTFEGCTRDCTPEKQVVSMGTYASKPAPWDDVPAGYVFPDPDAEWIWNSLDGLTSPVDKDLAFTRQIYSGSTTPIKLHVIADNYAQVLLNNVHIGPIPSVPDNVPWITKGVVLDMTLAPGMNTLRIEVHDVAGPAGLVAAAYKQGTGSDFDKLIFRTDNIVCNWVWERI